MKFLVPFTSARHNGKIHYRGIILLDGSMKLQFGQIFDSYQEFTDWLEKQCQPLAEGKEFRVVDLQINHSEIEEPYSYK